jgi:nucleolar protein 53
VRSPSALDVHSQPDHPVRTSLPLYSKLQLTSAKILSQRSTVPAVVSRATKPFSANISRADKERLLRIAKRPQKGPLNAFMDPTKFGAGSTSIDVSHAVKHSQGHDLWDVPAVEEIVPEG